MSASCLSSLRADRSAPADAGRVLVVDDDPDTVNLVGLTLERAGFNVIKARNGREALDLADSVDPEAIVLDVMMPEMSGLEVINALKAKYPWPPPVIMLTAKVQIADKVQGLEAGAFKYLTKPSPRDVLIEAVKEAVASKRSRPRLTGRR